VFVDAKVDVPPGNVAVTRLGAGVAGQGALVHHLAGRFYGRAPVAFRVTVGAASTELDEGLSQPVAAAVPTAIAAIQALLTGHAAPQHSLI
jgi:hypothetical protein